MSFLEKLGFRKPAPILAPTPVALVQQEEPRIFVPGVQRPFVNTEALGATGLRISMWVMLGEQLAIVTGCRADGLVEVTLQLADGTTQMELSGNTAVNAKRLVVSDSLRRAHIEEIPASRHEGEAHLRSFGYISASEVVQ